MGNIKKRTKQCLTYHTYSKLKKRIKYPLKYYPFKYLILFFLFTELLKIAVQNYHSLRVFSNCKCIKLE